MNNTTTCFITLTPLQLFFFGGEQGETADYFVKGSAIPQQTALLGLIRHQVLLQNNYAADKPLMANNIITDDEEAKKWIGEKSFEYNSEHQTFGKIQSLSPVYLVKKENNGVLTRFLPGHQAYCNNVVTVGGNFHLPDYSPKKYYPDVWASTDGSAVLTNDDVFCEIVKPGVDKNYMGKTEDGDDAYYKQVWIKMKNGLSFGFYVTLDADVSLQSADVTFGKESSAFRMEVGSPVAAVETFADEAGSGALALVSDTYITEDILALTDFAVTDTVPFRNIISPTSRHTNYYKIDTNYLETRMRKSRARLLLCKRGSVFYCKGDNQGKLKKAIDSMANFRKIGYNHYHLIKTNY